MSDLFLIIIIVAAFMAYYWIQNAIGGDIFGIPGATLELVKKLASGDLEGAGKSALDVVTKIPSVSLTIDVGKKIAPPVVNVAKERGMAGGGICEKHKRR